jgi:hypothetical protein
VPVKNTRLALAGAAFHSEQICTGKGSRECGPFRFRHSRLSMRTLKFSGGDRRAGTVHIRPLLSHSESTNVPMRTNHFLCRPALSVQETARSIKSKDRPMNKIFSFAAMATMLAVISSAADAKGPGGLGGGGASSFSPGHSFGSSGSSFGQPAPVTSGNGASGYAPGQRLRSAPPVTSSPGPTGTGSSGSGTGGIVQ